MAENADLNLDIASQWCLLHNCHQDDPRHAYSYPICESHLRPSTATEDKAVLSALIQSRVSNPSEESNDGGEHDEFS